jgi:hypothetical protein
MKKRKKLKSAVLVSSLIGASLFYNHEHTYKPEYQIINYEESDAFATYSLGSIYIGDMSYISSLHNLLPTDILVVDERDSDDPNLKIIASYKIDDKDIRDEIIEVLEVYELMYPSKWNRSLKSMRLEWFVHNLLHDFNYKLDHTTDVDFNNEDEQKFDKEVIRKLLKL